MSRDTDAPDERELQASICLKVKNDETMFDLMTRILGCESDNARGALIRMDRKSVQRARQGVIGEIFIANALYWLGTKRDILAEFNLDPVFETVFEVVAPDRTAALDLERVAA
jgi:hypothetical protein